MLPTKGGHTGRCPGKATGNGNGIGSGRVVEIGDVSEPSGGLSAARDENRRPHNQKGTACRVGARPPTRLRVLNSKDERVSPPPSVRPCDACDEYSVGVLRMFQ